jgi:predicted nucleic-acid-binding protein
MRNMEITDANVILRYLLKDDADFFSKSRVIIENKKIFFPLEVCAEVVYVLEKVYKVPRKNIQEALTIFINNPNITTVDNSLLKESLEVFETENIDFIDAVLVAYNHVLKAKIHSFDKKLMKLCH